MEPSAPPLRQRGKQEREGREKCACVGVRACVRARAGGCVCGGGWVLTPRSHMGNSVATVFLNNRAGERRCGAGGPGAVPGARTHRWAGLQNQPASSRAPEMRLRSQGPRQVEPFLQSQRRFMDPSSSRRSDTGCKPPTRINLKIQTEEEEEEDHLVCEAQPCRVKHATTMNRKLWRPPACSRTPQPLRETRIISASFHSERAAPTSM